MDQNILTVENITKSYPGVRALDNVSIDIKRGEVHAIAGENGAGKSTLIKILTGAVLPDSGKINLEGKTYPAFTPHQAIDLGIAAIYQELNLIPYLSVAENVFFGREIRFGPFINSRTMSLQTSSLLAKLGIAMDPDTLVKDLSVAFQQIVEIAKAVSHDLKILIMDEPTASLTVKEVRHMFDLVKNLKEKGVTVIYISHKMSEIFELADRITVLRDGRFIETLRSENTQRRQLVSLMVGKELGETYPEKTAQKGNVLLKVKNICTGDLLKNISFKLEAGEILGFAGLVGAGRTQLARAIFGADKIESGDILIDGKKVFIKNPDQAVKHGIGLIPEDRKLHGILANMSVKENISFSSLKDVSRFRIINSKQENNVTSSFRQKLNIKTPDMNCRVENLSGGNQQKVVLSKWLASHSRILIFDEPTRGVDVAAKQQIYELIANLAEAGTGIILISSETEELIGMADRILVMRAGSITGSFEKGQATQQSILDLAIGD